MQLDLFDSKNASEQTTEMPAATPVDSKSKKKVKGKRSLIVVSSGTKSGGGNGRINQKLAAPKTIDSRKIEIDNILIDCYPRESVSAQRVSLFADLLAHEVELPNIKLAEEGGVFYLIDGRHRLTANQKAGNSEIAADILDIPRKEWMAYAVQFNTGESLQLSGKELKSAIWHLYSIDKLDQKRISMILGAKPSWIYSVTEEARRVAQAQLRRRCYDLHAQGNTIRQIEEETGVKKSTAQRYIKEEEAAIQEAEEKEKERAVRAEKARQRAEKRQKKRAQNFERMNESCLDSEIECQGDLQDAIEGTADASVVKHSERLAPDPEFEALLSAVKDPSANFISPDELVYSAMQPCEDDPIFVPPDQDVSLIKDLSKVETTLDSTQRSILFVIHHIVKETPLKEITKVLDCPEEWVRNTAFAMLFFYHYDEISVDDVSTKLSMCPERVAFIEMMYNTYPGCLPKREALFCWIDENMPEYVDNRYLVISRREKLYWHCQQNGRQVPWEMEEDQECYDIPPEIADTFEKTCQYLERFQAQIDNVKLNKLQAQALLEKNNRLTIFVNQIARILADNAMRDE